MSKGSEYNITAIAFIAALSIHGLILGAPMNIFSFLEKVPPEEELVVEINIEKPKFLPDIKKIAEKKVIKEKRVEPEERIEKPEEVVISDEEKIEEKVESDEPDTEEMFRYKDAIRQRIESYRRYPRSARKHKIEGITVLTFMISEKGTVSSIKVVRSSGYKVLDTEAVATVKRASPFPSIPSGINRFHIEMEVAIVFNLK